MFDQFWKIYPHHQARSKKAASRALFQAITGKGHEGTVIIDGTRIRLTLTATPEEIVAGAKAYCQTLDDRQYAAGAQVWLNQGRWEDNDNVEELAAKYDRIQKIIEEKGIKTVVPLTG